MLVHGCVHFVIPLLYFLSVKVGSSASSKASSNNVYSPIIQSICNGSTRDESCMECLEPIINDKTIALTELGDNVTNSLRRCLSNASEAFHNFRCLLLETVSYKFEDFIGATCVRSLQSSNPYLNLSGDLSKTKSNLGYFHLGEVTATTLYGILKYSNDSNVNTNGLENTQDKGVCSFIKNSSFLPSLSQANGHSWESHIGYRVPLFFTIINQQVCEGNQTCVKCLETILNVGVVKPQETSAENFLKLLECKSFVPKMFFNYISSISEIHTVQNQVPQTCLDYLRPLFKNFRFNKNLNTSDLVKNTFYIQEIIKFGIGTAFYYFNVTKGRVPDAMFTGVCHDVIVRYIETFQYAMDSFHTGIEEEYNNPDLQSKSPYIKLFERICNEGDKYCQACHQKVGYSVNVKYPAEISGAVIKVFGYCEGFQKDAFKGFASNLTDTSFETCMKNKAAYKVLFDGYPINNKTNIRTTSTRPNFTNYRVFLNFGYSGICYYYQDANQNDDVTRRHGDSSTLSARLHDIGLPGAYLFVMPGLNLVSALNISECLPGQN